MSAAAPGLGRGLGRVGSIALDVLLPGRCLRCGGIVADAGAMCSGCWEAISFIAPPFCGRCGEPFEFDLAAGALCGACMADSPVYHRARAVMRYDDASKPLVLRFKHSDRTAAAPSFARWLARAGAELLADAEVIVPVPLHRWRLWRRRYNQAALLAQALAKDSGRLCVPDALVRVRATPSQGTLGRGQRRRNVQGAFALRRPSAVDARKVLLIDDVLTTGATVGECARVLMRGGAASVDVLTLARVVLAPHFENAEEPLYS